MSRTSAASCERCGVDFARCRRARGLGICVDCRDTDPEIAAKKRAYYEQNRDEIAAKKRAYREQNRDEIAAKQRAYREQNRDEIAAKKRAYYEQNRDEIAAKQRAQRQADPERHREYVRKYRAWKKAASSVHGTHCSRCGIDYTRCAPAHGVDLCLDCHETELETAEGGLG